MNVDRLIAESLDDPAQIAETVIRAVVDVNKKVLTQQLRRLKKIKGSSAHSILIGSPFLEGGAINDLAQSLEQLLNDFDIQEEIPYNDREWDESMAARFPTMDSALTVLSGCEKLTPELYELAHDDVGPWEGFEEFSIGDPFGVGEE
jgi:hypothetical protein